MASVPAVGDEAASWRRLADNMRSRADRARPDARDILSRMADLFESAPARAVRDEQGSPVAVPERSGR